MEVIRVDREILIAAPRQRVWGILVDHEKMPRWFPAREVVRRRRGEPDPNGVGAVRVARVGGLAVEERITAFKPEERLEYALTEGAPIRDHRGEVVLRPVEGDTQVCWSVTFRPLIPGTGWIARRIVGRTLAEGLAGLKRLAESG